MGTVTCINLTPYNLQPVPEVGKEYHIFDDGKISSSRHYIAKITEVISFDDCSDIDLKEAWCKNVAECYWLFKSQTDYFIKAASDYDENPLYFVRTTDGGWFSIDYPSCWMGARLDIDGELYKSMTEFGGVKKCVIYLS
jgi:hypothetical protein